MPNTATKAPKKKLTLKDRFDAFDAAHPEIYERFKAYAEILRRKRSHYSARLILSGLSFNSVLDGRDVDTFKINNNWSPYYARKLAAEDQKFEQFFKMRRLVAAE